MSVLISQMVTQILFQNSIPTKLTKMHISNLLWSTLNKGRNRSKYHKNRCPFLSLKWVPKSTFKTQFQENWQNCMFSTLVWPTFNEAKISPNLIKIGVHAYLWNGYLNPLSKLNFEKVEKKCIFSTLDWSIFNVGQNSSKTH